MAPPVGLEPTTHGLTVRRSTDWAKGEYLCWHYLSSRQVTLQVLWARVSLTSVFGMGTGGPSLQSIPTLCGGFSPPLCQSGFRSNSFWIIAPFLALVNPFLFPYRIKAQRSGFDSETTNDDTGEKTRSRVFEHCIIDEELVTRTGFEPMLKAWEASVLTTWPTGHWCTFTDSNRGPTD